MRTIPLLFLCSLSLNAFSQQQVSDEYLQARNNEVRHEMDSLLYHYQNNDPNDERIFRIVVSDWIIESMTEQKNNFVAQPNNLKENIAKAEYTVGCFYNEERKKEQTFKWFMRAAQLGQRDAMFHIGQGYEQGFSKQKKDINEAIKWYTKASELGCYEAMHSLGSIYYDRKETKADLAKAFEYFKSAAKEGNAKAIAKLGNIYDDGDIVKRNIHKAMSYWQDAAEKGEYQCYALQGKKYLEGDGVKQNENKAVACFQQGYKLKDPNSTLQLALCYYNGLGVETNYYSAFSMLKSISFSLDSSIGHFYLGECFRLGRGVEINYIQAAIWYKYSIKRDSNYEPPREELKKLLNEGKIKQSDISRF